MNKILETNILIIGKSGVGKSSLLNYIFDKQLMETGTGRPVTKKGIFPKKIEIKENFILNVSDTWGLEANKAKEWKQLIDDEIKKHDCAEISDWFHTILFCISAKSSRVEEFEKEIIKGLIDDGNKVIVVLTHSDTNNIDETIDEMSVELNGAGVEETSIIRASSVSKKLLSGKTTETFGKEKILYLIQTNLWHTICNKLPKIIDDIIGVSLDNWYSRSEDYVKSEVKWYGSKSNRKLSKIGDHIEYLLDKEMDTLKDKLNQKYNEAYDYYFKMSKMYQLAIQEDKEGLDYDSKFDFKIDKFDRIVDNLALMIVNLIPFGIFFTPGILRDERIDSIMETLRRSKNQLSKQLIEKNKAQIEVMKRYKVN